MQGFNNEHPNAKRAAVMKKKDWVRYDFGPVRAFSNAGTQSCMHTPVVASSVVSR